MPEETEEVEIIPISPLRRLEKRIEELEASKAFDTKELYKELIDIIRMNQQIVDELAKANDALRIELSKLPSRLEDLTSRLEELINFIKASAEEEVASKEGLGAPISQKLDQLIEMTKKMVETNQAIQTSLDELEKRLRRPPSITIKKPLLPPKPTV
jgi:regulator of replication initiation timing